MNSFFLQLIYKATQKKILIQPLEETSKTYKEAEHYVQEQFKYYYS